MTVTLHLKPEIEAGLVALARERGMAVEDYLLSLAEEALGNITAETDSAASRARKEEAVRRMIEFGERHNLGLGEPITRKLLHEGHRI